MLDIWKEVERSEQAVADAETDEQYTQALQDLEDVLKRYAARVQECIDQCQVIVPDQDPAATEQPGK